MAKYKLIGLIAGGAFVVLMMASAPFVLMGIDALTSDVPDEEEVCQHLTGDLSLPLSDCDGWLSDSQATYGDYANRRLRCLHAASNEAEAVRCDDMANLGANWRD